MSTAKTNNTLISIIVPSFNQGAFIENTILSVLNQNYDNWELLIQDNNSSDETKDVSLRYCKQDKRISFTSESDNGFADAVNRALKRARGALVGIQSSDDFYSNRDVFREVDRIYREYAGLYILSGNSIKVDENLKRIPIEFPYGHNGFIDPDSVFLLKNFFAQSSTFFCKYRAEFIGGLDTELDYVADTDFYVRLCSYDPVSLNSVYRCSQTWGCEIIHEAQRSTDRSEFNLCSVKMALKHFDDEKILVSKSQKKDHLVRMINIASKYYSQRGLDTNDINAISKEVIQISIQPKIRLFNYLMRNQFIRDLFNRNIKKGLSDMTETIESSYSVKWF